MRIQDILRTIKDNFYLALILVSILVVFLLIGYSIIYRMILKGTKKLSKGKIFICFCFIGYIIMVIGVTFLNRSSGMFGDVNLHFLSSYREAWNSFSCIKWRFIVLNIVMLVPFGMLLPLLNSRFRKLKCIFPVAFLTILTIETTQFITGYGIFELDDILNNMIGAIIGFGVIMMILTLIEDGEKDYKKAMTYLLPLIIVSGFAVAVVGVYYSKEFGNLYISHNHKVNMKNTDVNLNTEIDIESKVVFLNGSQYNISEVPIFRTQKYDKDNGQVFFINFLKNKDVDETIEIDPYKEMAIYWSRGEPTYNMSFYFNNGSYSYRDFSSFDDGFERVYVDEEMILKTLEEFDVSIPESAVFTKTMSQWSVENYIDGDYIINGRLSAEYYNDDSIKGIINNIIRYTKVRDISIKSKEEAYQEFKKGKFNLYGSEDIKKVYIEDISLTYRLDSKSFYQPVYQFKVEIDGIKGDTFIPAIL